ncbi:MAG: hypothetical protein Q4A30_01485 [Candidatus Saccharibacteria bacterium]|nr:hypothetical protein [Candidatus Saccharibacteria bacterium]
MIKLMNKDVIYIEPEDDITDIINRLKSAKQKVVALVPPKKLGALRSTINTKLVAKVAKASDKAVVIVTVDPALIKMSAAAGLPVAKTLQSRPIMPSELQSEPSISTPELIEEAPETEMLTSKTEVKTPDISNTTSQPQSADSSKTPPTSNSAELQLNSVELEDAAQSETSGSASKTKIPDFNKYRKWIILGVSVVVVLIIFGIWALIFAPAAEIMVAVRSVSNNFSENISFVTQSDQSNTSEGRFLLEEQKYSEDTTIEFTATGKKDIGEKATGELVVMTYFRGSGTHSRSIPVGTVFKYQNDLQYNATAATTLDWDGADGSCQNPGRIGLQGCLRTAKVKVQATQSGEKYNLIPHSDGWSLGLNGVYAYSETAMTGGTTKLITVIQQSDIDQAKEKLLASNDTDGKEKLLAQIRSDILPIELSFKATAHDPVSTPALGEEVKDGQKANLKATTSYTIFGVDQVAIKEHIKSITEAKLASDQKFYNTTTPFIERFSENAGKYTAKLKATTQSGPKVTEQDIMEKSKGRKIGEVQSLIKSINGVKDVRVNTSYFWVYAIPDDPNKIKINLKIEES